MRDVPGRPRPTRALTLSSPVREIDPLVASRRTGLEEKGPPAWRVLAEGLGIRTVRDLLHHYPRAYIDRSQVSPIRSLRIGQHATVIGRIKEVKARKSLPRRGRRPMPIVTVVLADGTGYLELTFFNQPWAARTYRAGMELAASGVVGRYGRSLQLRNQEVEILRAEADAVHTARITPVHPATEGVTTRTIRELVHRALARIPEIPDPLPPAVVEAEGLLPLDLALRRIHFPERPEELAAARERLKFDELFTLELGVAFRKHRVEAAEVGVAHEPDGPLTRRLASTLPFELTGAQRRAIAEISAAMARPRPMNVLLQGDVGAGKTVVALHACLVAIQSGHQAAVMAPTEVLAGQHLRSMGSLLGPLGARPYLEAVPDPPAASLQPSLLDRASGEDGGAPGPPPLTYALLTAAVTGRDRRAILEGIAAGAVDLVVGTHALVQEGVAFADLSLAVIDEQHRFGVHQRMALKGKGASPDVLIMTATPIPRTLALTYYGDLDVVVLDELPGGRQPVETVIVRSADERRRAYELVRREVAAGRQAFVVTAAIDEGNRLEVKAAEAEAERLATQVFPDLRVGLLHGRMRPAEKERRMEAFRAGEIQVLISTTVIEVGVDVPNATVMLVENAERFGLAQLHQLRGRIGRGAHRSYCVLFDESGPENPEARQRLEAMARTTDGFALADEDLRLRGEGTLFDVRQSGMPDLKLARLAEDLELVKRARRRAFALISEDPTLERHPALLAELRIRFERGLEWLFHS
ncbi:MAG TPA: ATP-dependent DNA helicase RecG [Actinomycetota bacterium]|nr:ATP-dependent DNA helicase RecG [Actinomycetota bacterium]